VGHFTIVRIDMDKLTFPRMPLWIKLAFFLGDALLLGVALIIVVEAPRPLPLAQAVLLTVAVMNGAILFIIPFILEYKAQVKLTEVAQLRVAADRFKGLEEIQQQIRVATGQWQSVQDHCTKAVGAATEVKDQMTREAKAFAEMGERNNDAERAHLRLEVDKMRRGEQEWLEAMVRVCDHVFALYRAGVESGQPALQEQLGLFQRAVRDSVRRVGLVPHEATEDEPYSAQKHQGLDPNMEISPGAPIQSTVATGYTFQGQPIRRIVVTTKPQPALTSAPEDPAGPQLSLVSDEPNRGDA
jgi:hypothetical protein